MAAVELRGLAKRFGRGGADAVHDVDLAVGDGEFLVFLGPSGSGKSTLLRMIAGLEEPTRGEIRIGGLRVNDLAPRERGIAMVFQSYALYPHLTVAGNIEFPLRVRRTGKAERARQVAWAAGLLGIAHLLDRRPRELSGGERQRVALARAIVRDPSVFLLDEPLSNLDAKLRASAREELTAFHRRVGTTTLYVTHDQVEAMAMGNRILVLDGGTVRQLGSPREVYEEPADTFVATFLGSPPMNLLDVGETWLGFRPEHLRPAAAVAGRSAGMGLRVEGVEFLGAECVLHGALAEGRLSGAHVVARLPSPEAAGLRPGDVHPFAVPLGDLHHFDRRTGARVAAREVPWP